MYISSFDRCEIIRWIWKKKY